MKGTRSQEMVIDEALRAAGGVVERTGAFHWNVGLGNGRPLDVEARADAGWLSLRAQTDRAPGDCYALLALNTGLGAASRIGLALDDWSLRLCSEVPLVEGANLPGRIAEAFVGLKEASERLLDDAPDRSTQSAAEADPSASAGGCGGPRRSAEREGGQVGPELADACREAGWTTAERRGDALAIELDVAGACHHAILARDANEGVAALSVEVMRWEVVTPIVRRAVGVLLLSACHALRFARAATAGSDELTARFEVTLGPAPSALELDVALRALSAACLLYAREVDVLRDEALAARFLEMVWKGRFEWGRTLESHCR